MISACGANSNVAGDSFLQKRKYRKGVHLNILKKHKVQEQSIPDEVIAQNIESEQKSEDSGSVDSEENESIISAESVSLEVLEARKVAKKEATVLAFRRAFSRKSKQEPMAISPDEIKRQNTLTSQYQAGGKKALLFAWIFAILPLLAWMFGVLGLPMLQVAALFFALLFLILALIFAMRNRKYSAHARKALLLILIAIVFWAAAASIASFLLAVALL